MNFPFNRKKLLLNFIHVDNTENVFQNTILKNPNAALSCFQFFLPFVQQQSQVYTCAWMGNVRNSIVSFCSGIKMSLKFRKTKIFQVLNIPFKKIGDNLTIFCSFCKALIVYVLRVEYLATHCKPTIPCSTNVFLNLLFVKTFVWWICTILEDKTFIRGLCPQNSRFFRMF